MRADEDDVVCVCVCWGLGWGGGVGWGGCRPPNGSMCAGADEDDDVGILCRFPSTEACLRGLVKMTFFFVSVVDPPNGSVCAGAGEDDALPEMSGTDQHQAVQQLLPQHDERLPGAPRGAEPRLEPVHRSVVYVLILCSSGTSS